ncbi:MAG: signal peptidase I [SAR324 cluster bacterium]|nr:signal peptidase I [SAR324 cluster bacterium]
MIFSRSYRLTGASLDELEEGGVPADKLQALKKLVGRSFATRQEYLLHLDEVLAAPTTPAERKLYLKYGRGSFLGLERLIPHRSTREWVEALLFAFVVAALVRTFFFAPFKIPSGSMVPTIAVGDHIFATMYNYGIPVPFTDTKLFPREISRGDIVIFPYPLDPSVDYIKRVVALGGETVSIRGTTVYINNEPLDEPYAYFDPILKLARFGNNGEYMEKFGPVTLPPGMLFVMGDNRLNSRDSREWGFVDGSTVRGRGQIVYWSHNPDESFLSGYQWGRIGTLLR